MDNIKQETIEDDAGVEQDDNFEFVEYIIEEVVETEEFVEEEYIDCDDLKTENQIQYQCDICHRLFDKHYYLEKHMHCHNEPNPLYEEVIECDDELVGSNEGANKEIQCDVCDITFNTFQQLNEHRQTHKKLYTCSVCEKMYRTRNSLYKHFQHVHTKLDKCIACNEVFTDIIEHVKFHHGEKCPICEKHYFELSELNEHILTVHVVKQENEEMDKSPEMRCNVCSKQFTNMIHLQAHIRRTHSKEKMLECPLCGKQFKSANSFTCYTSHINIHTGEKPYKCQYCSKTFGNSGTLHKHKKIHTGENFHRCTLCDKKFRDASYLTRHLKSCSFKYSAGEAVLEKYLTIKSGNNSREDDNDVENIITVQMGND